jgi:hypothetical protein
MGNRAGDVCTQASCTIRMPIWSLISALLFSLAASSFVSRLFLILSLMGLNPTYCSRVRVPGITNMRPSPDAREATESKEATRRTVCLGADAEPFLEGGSM